MQPGSVTINGKTYPFCADDSIAVVREFEAWMVKSAWEELDRSLAFISPTRFKEQEDGLRRDLTAKLYRWGGDIYRQMRGTTDGQRMLLRAMFQLADQKAQVNGLVEELLAMPDGPELRRIAGELYGHGTNPTGGTTEIPASQEQPKS